MLRAFDFWSYCLTLFPVYTKNIVASAPYFWIYTYGVEELSQTPQEGWALNMHVVYTIAGVVILAASLILGGAAYVYFSQDNSGSDLQTAQ
jgi:hypothetical protein